MDLVVRVPGLKSYLYELLAAWPQKDSYFSKP